MDNVTTYLPSVNQRTLEEFYQAHDDGRLTSYVSQFIESVAEDIEGSTREEIECDKVNFEALVRAEYNDNWEAREASLNDISEIEFLAQDY